MTRPQESSNFQPRQMRDLRKMVARGEGASLEFKRKASYPDKIVREMIAFANAGGGILLVGVADNGELAGLKHPEDESHVIQQSLRKCQPKLPVEEIFIPIGDNRFIIQYNISESRNKPHYFVDGERKEAFIRVNDQSIRASRELRESNLEIDFGWLCLPGFGPQCSAPLVRLHKPVLLSP